MTFGGAGATLAGAENDETEVASRKKDKTLSMAGRARFRGEV